MKRILKYMSVGLLALAFCLALGACLLLSRPEFGGSPNGARLKRLRNSAHFVDGAFRNRVVTPKFTQDVSTFSIVLNELLHPAKRRVPDRPIPSLTTDLKRLERTRDVVIWLGHSSFFIQLGGKRILLDPIFSDHAAPLSFMNKAFAGTNIYRAEDMPPIDCLLISHDHWDHLDYATVTALKDKVGRVVCPLGVGAYLEKWGYETNKIREADWYDHVDLGDALTIHVLPARHYSGRLWRQNKTLWAGFAMVSSSRRLFFSGDSGYGPHFAEIGRKFGRFDLVALDCGQYDDRWAYIHMTPEEAVMAAEALNAGALLPAHVGRFTIARHPWDEPFQRITAAADGKNALVLTPVIGQQVMIADAKQHFSRWWEKQ